MVATSKKDVPLEAVRGLASITVLLWHSMLGFFPQWADTLPDKRPPQALNGQVWFGLIYGTAAVTLFFVLSGFVLTRRFLMTGDEQIILRGAIKRWPRLTGPVLVTVLVSWLLFRLDAYRFTEGGALTGSLWLSKYALGSRGPFTPNFWDALREGDFSTFFRGDAYYDGSIWTMHLEFIGSFIAFGLALLIALFPEGTKLLRFAMIGMVLLLCYWASPIYASFPVGVALAAFLPERRIKLPGWTVGGLILVAIYLFGFTGVKVGAYVLAALVFKSHVVAVEIFASVLVVTAIELASDTFRQRLSNRFCELLGALSFPLYLIHVLVLCSLGCAILIWTGTWMTAPYPSIIAAAATIIGSVLAAIPLLFFNEHWVALVNTAINQMLSPPLSQIITEPDNALRGSELPSRRSTQA